MSTFHEAMGLLPPVLRRRWIAVAALLALAAGAELVTATAIFALAGGGKTASMVSWVPPGTVTLLGGIAVILLVKNALLAAAALLQSRVTADSSAAVFERIVTGLLWAPYRVLVRRPSADVLQHVVQGANLAYRVYVGAAVSIAGESLVALGIAIVIFAIAPGPALLAVTVVGVTLLLSLRATASSIRRGSVVLQESERSMLRSVQEILLGIREIRTGQREQGFLTRATSASRRFAEALRAQLALLAVPRIAHESLFIVVAVLLFIVLRRTAVTEREAFALLTVFGYAGLRCLPSANRFAYAFRQLKQYEHAVAELVVLAREVELAPPPRRSLRSDRRAPSLQLSGVSYRYEGCEGTAVSKVSVAIASGEMVAFVGPNGSGKSTLLDLLAGMLDPPEGEIRVDGAPLQSWLAATPPPIAYVPQTPFLVDETVTANVTFDGDPQTSDAASSARVLQAALDARIETLAGALRLVGENGRSLSGGQRQRVAFARALFQDAQLLLLDEWSAAIDAADEAVLRERLTDLRGSKTIVFVTQDLEATRNCDRIFVMENGCVVESGTYDELHAADGAFGRLRRVG